MMVCSIQFNPIKLVFNFIPLTIIASFDNVIYESFQLPVKKLIDDADVDNPVFPIVHTSSRRCSRDQKSDEIDPATGEPRPTRICFSDRTCLQKICWVIYRIYRTVFCGYYFYFMPYTIYMMAFIIPLLYYDSTAYSYGFPGSLDPTI